jgi:hypothetical protein
LSNKNWSARNKTKIQEQDINALQGQQAQQLLDYGDFQF